MTEYDYQYICRSCRVRHDIEDLVSVEKHGYPWKEVCPDCEGETFTKVPLEVEA